MHMDFKTRSTVERQTTGIIGKIANQTATSSDFARLTSNQTLLIRDAHFIREDAANALQARRAATLARAKITLG
jgi:hypothetical protein